MKGARKRGRVLPKSTDEDSVRTRRALPLTAWREKDK